MIKLKDKKSLLGKALALASLTLISLTLTSIKVNAVQGLPGQSNDARDKLTAQAISPDGIVTRASFNWNAPGHTSWYDGVGGRSNQVFLSSYKDFTVYSIIPQPANYNYSNTRNNGQMYENANVDPGYIQAYGLVYGSPNFKNWSTDLNDISLSSARQGAGVTNQTSPYKGVNGEWRYIGYSSYGDDIGNPYFPSDCPPDYYEQTGDYNYQPNPWNHPIGCPSGATKWDDQSTLQFESKLYALDLLLQQEPTMAAVKADRYWWAKRLSLRNDPRITSAVFKGSNGPMYRTVVLKEPPNLVHNLRVISQVVTEKKTGKIMGQYTLNEDPKNYIPVRSNPTEPLEAGEEYTVTVKVKNMSKLATVSKSSLLDTGCGYGSAYNSGLLGFSDNQIQSTLESEGIYEGTYKGNETKEFSWTLGVGEEFGKKLRVTAMIDNIHNINGDNLDGNDDTADLYFKVKGVGGNFGLQYIKLVGRDGKEYDRATPGEDYKIRYYVHYKGSDIKIPIYRTVCGKHSCWSVFDHWYYPIKYIPLDVEIDRNIPPVHRYADIYKEVIPKSDEVHNDWTYVYTTKDYRTYEVPIIRTTATLSSYLTDIEKAFDDSDSADNQLSAEWHELYDLSVSDLKITPITETPYQPGYQYFAVQYTINSKAPTWLPSYEKDVRTMIALGNGSPVSFVDHVARGGNTLITHEMKIWVDPAHESGTIVNGTVTMNYDRMVWEEDVLKQKNNQVENKVTIVPPYDPWNGPPLQNTKNVWTQNYNVHNWTGYHKTYVDLPSQSFNIFTPSGDNPKTMKQSENYNITSIKFKSKLTTDTNQGENGWVELINGTAGMIKAGYGYELKITVNYNTNAFNQPQPKVSGNYNENGTWVRPYNVTPNLPNQLFVETPDKQILSVDGYSDTNSGLQYTVKGDRTDMTWVYTVVSKDTLDVNKSMPKVFIDPNTKDGLYDLKVFTPAINGVPTKTAGGQLCDSKTVKIKVQGADTDDLKSHITQ